LLAKREQIGKRIVDLRKQVTRHKAEIVRIDAAIALFATDLTAARRKASRFSRSEHFAGGALTRRCRGAMRQASGPISADERAVKAMQDKGMDLADVATRADFVQRFVWALTRMLAHHRVEKIGRGPDARWGLPTR
jgi:hypothetical protein